MVAATSCSAGARLPSARSRCARTIDSAPPSSRSVASRRTDEPRSRSTCHSRSSTSCRYGASIRSSSFSTPPTAGSPDVDLPRRDLVEDDLHELGLDLDRFAGQLVVALDRPEDRGAAALACRGGRA